MYSPMIQKVLKTPTFLSYIWQHRCTVTNRQDDNTKNEILNASSGDNYRVCFDSSV